jgi:hypothetical protein
MLNPFVIIATVKVPAVSPLADKNVTAQNASLPASFRRLSQPCNYCYFYVYVQQNALTVWHSPLQNFLGTGRTYLVQQHLPKLDVDRDLSKTRDTIRFI